MPRQTIVTLYKFEELSEKAQDKAIRLWRNTADYSWQKENVDSLNAFAKAFDITITEWSYGSRSSGVSFKLNNEFHIAEMSGQRLAKYLWNNHEDVLLNSRYYSLWSKKDVSFEHYKDGYPVLKQRRSKVFFERENCNLTGYEMDNALMKPLYRFLEKPNTTTFEELIENCFHEWTKACEADIEYQESREYIIHTLMEYDYEFTEDGTLQ